MSENSILKRYLTHIPFGVILLVVMMAFALVASIEAAEPAIVDPDGFVWAPENAAEFTKHYNDRKAMAEALFADLHDLGLTFETEQSFREAINYLVNKSEAVGELRGITAAVNAMKQQELEAEDSSFELDPGLGCITDSECEGLDPDVRYFSS